MNKQPLLHWAEVIDSLRIIPRLFLLACFLWTVDISHLLLKWYMALPKEDRGIEASGFASVVFLTVFGFMKLVFQTYSENGRIWPAAASTTTASTATTTVTSHDRAPA
jgi:hypothetical protein